MTATRGLALACVARLEAADMMAEAAEALSTAYERGDAINVQTALERLETTVQVYRRVSRVVVEATCPTCNGTGRELLGGERWTDCEGCHGTGMVLR